MFATPHTHKENQKQLNGYVARYGPNGDILVRFVDTQLDPHVCLRETFLRLLLRPWTEWMHACECTHAHHWYAVTVHTKYRLAGSRYGSTPL